jgi:glycosyltransferase involved in cell wall biosynthesis
MKILIVPDIPNWAIGKLVDKIIRYNPQHTFRMECVHPEDAEREADKFEQIVNEFQPDLIHYNYFRSAATLIEKKPFLKKYPSILSHHNQRDKALYWTDWNNLGIDLLVTGCNGTRELLNAKNYLNVQTINYGIDLDFFNYSDKEPEEKTIGYAGRVVPWKNLKEISEVATKLNYPVQIMGSVIKESYWNEVDKTMLRYDFMNCSDEERVEAYRNMTIFVCFAKNGYEEGPLPVLEAMACGVPVITTPCGMAKDIIENEKNGIVVDFGDIEALETQIKRLMEDSELRAQLRKNAWQTIKHFTEQKMAYEYSKAYHQVVYPDHTLVSVITPTYNRKEQTLKILDSLRGQTYPHIEVVICDDNSDDGTYGAVMQYIKKHPEMTIKLLETGKDGYNLAMARNMGAIEAEGNILVFCDSRLKPEENAIMFFKEAVENASAITMGGNKKVWFFGNKGSDKRNFVENFSAVDRELFIQFGMFNERIDKYGGMSQEIRTRWVKQGGEFTFLPSVQATELTKAHSINERRKDIIEMKLKLFKMYGGEAY